MHSIILKIMDEKYLLIIFSPKLLNSEIQSIMLHKKWLADILLIYAGITKLPIKQLRVLNISN